MIFFGSSLQLYVKQSDHFGFSALVDLIIERIRQRLKPAFLMAACLCVGSSAYANSLVMDSDAPTTITTSTSTSTTSTSTTKTYYNIKRHDADSNSANATYTLPTTEIQQPEFNAPSLYALLDAEFAADRGQTQRALNIYKHQAFREDATAVFERALKLSLAHESVTASLAFAKTWQDQNPDHVPAWFYVAHLALRAQNYALAGDSLSRIISYDPRADLSEILIGIYPTTDDDKRELLTALQPLDSEQNASLSVLKAGLLFQFDEPEVAIVHINRALALQPDYVPFITLKADILRKIEPAKSVLSYISQARLRNSDSKSLYLYEIRYLLDLQQRQQAWTLLLEAHDRFSDDAEITLLAALVSLDIESYASADKLLNSLAKSPAYLDQAYYYLGISAERQGRMVQAKNYFNSVMQEDLVLEARKKVVSLELVDNNIEAAIATLQNLRQSFSTFAPLTYVLEADILRQQNQSDEAKRLLTRASRQYPDNETLLFARAQLLDDQDDYVIKRTLLNHLQALDPNNLAYQLNYAQLLLANDRNSEQGLALARSIIDIRYDDPRYDNQLHLQALNVLASNALAKQNYQQVIAYLKTPYDVLPTLRSGTLLLRAYQGLGESDKVEVLLSDLQQRFSFGQQNINDSIQLY